MRSPSCFYIELLLPDKHQASGLLCSTCHPNVTGCHSNKSQLRKASGSYIMDGGVCLLMPLCSPYYVFPTWAELDFLCVYNVTQQAPQLNVNTRPLLSKQYGSVLTCPLFLFVFWFVCLFFRLQGIVLYRGSVILTPHTLNTYLKGVLISKPVFGVIIHLKCSYLL